MQAVVLAGGKGSRLAGDARPPKVLLPLAGAPVLDHIVGWLASQGVADVVLCTGWQAEQVEAAVGDGTRFGLSVRCSREASPLGTAGAVKAAEALLEDRFLVVYGDVIADVDLAALWKHHELADALATLAVHPNDHPFDSDRVVASVDGFARRMVRKEDQAGPAAGALCTAALYVVDKRLLARVPADGTATDFARDIFPAAIAAGEHLAVWRTAEYLKDMGTPARAEKVEAELRRGVPRAMRRATARPALFVDRDGVLVENVPHLKRLEDLRLLAGSAEALARANAARWLTVCCSNQPVIARGELSEEGLHEIHRHLEGLLGERGAWLDGLFYCPHHPHRGFAGERAEFKGPCLCRKPMPGLLFQAEAALGIDRAASVFVGDHTTDLLAARRAGVLPIGVRTGFACADGVEFLPPEVPVVDDLAQAVALAFDAAPCWDPFLAEVRRRRVVLVGGPSRAGKTLAAAALRLRLQSLRVPVVHTSLDRFIVPASERVPSMPVAARTRSATASGAALRLCAGESVLVPGYDVFHRTRGPSELVAVPEGGVAIIDGLLALEVPVTNALRVALVAGEEELRTRRDAFYKWKGLAEHERAAAVDGRPEEHQRVAQSLARADLNLRFGTDLRLAREGTP